MDAEDEAKLSRPLLDLMGDHRLDFHSTFRRLAYFRPSMAHPIADSAGDNPALEEFVKSMLTLMPESQMVNTFKAASDLKAWLKTYAARIESERCEWEREGDVDAARERASRTANPRFVLRQWVLEEVIKKVEDDLDSGKHILAKVLQVCCWRFYRGEFRLTRRCIRWHAIPSRRGAERTIRLLRSRWMPRYGKRGGTAVSAKSKCLDFSVVALARASARL